MALENIHTWACRWFRPHVKTCLDQWIEVHLRDPGGYPDHPAHSKYRDNFRKAVPMVEDLLAEYKALPPDFPTFDDKVNPLALSLIIQQMSMLSHESLLESIERKVRAEIGSAFAKVFPPEQFSQGDAETDPSSEATGLGIADRDDVDALSEDGSDMYDPENAVRESTVATTASRTAPHQPNPKRSTPANLQLRPRTIQARSESVDLTVSEEDSLETSAVSTIGVPSDASTNTNPDVEEETEIGGIFYVSNFNTNQVLWKATANETLTTVDELKNGYRFHSHKKDEVGTPSRCRLPLRSPAPSRPMSLSRLCRLCTWDLKEKLERRNASATATSLLTASF